MMQKQRRRLPDGISSFEMIRKGGFVYVDKTDLVWQIANGSMFNYLCRPRRFGKSILLDTLACYFEGRRELFEGLKIMNLEEEWTVHPVVRLDLSNGGATAKELESYLDNTFSLYEKRYGIISLQSSSLAVRFSNIILTAFEQTGQTVAVLIDEYDSPLQHSWHTPEHEACTAIYRSVFAVLKTMTLQERFVFITGITTVSARRAQCQTCLNIAEPQPDCAKGKFTQISLFSVLNNLSNITFYAEYAAICGITKDEVVENFMPELERMCEKHGWSMEQTLDKLRANYDGYHFSKDNMVDVYNPYSMICALSRGDISNYWASSGATSLLPKFVNDMELRIKDFENVYVDRVTMEAADVSGGGAELFLYQAGYLTIHDADDEGYVLGFPNYEVRTALYRVVIPALTLRSQDTSLTERNRLLRNLNNNNLPEAMRVLKALVADVPYSNKKLQSIDMEERYRFIISSICYAIGLHTEVEHMMAKGRVDLVVWTRGAIYVIELKLTKNGGIAAAEQQIRNNLYAEPFRGDGREVVALAIELDDEGKGLLDWKRIE